MRRLLPLDRPLLILAPMQDITELSFWKVTARYGGPDLYYTEYFRVHRDSRPEKHILRSIEENPTGKPVVAQMIGQDIEALQRTARDLQKRPISGIDLNFGCPAPIVCKKDAGGGLLRKPERIDEIIHAVRDAVQLQLTVKTRIGFDEASEFPRLLEVFCKHPIDALTVHGRTVREKYQPYVHYDRIAEAVRSMPCPVFANGNVTSATTARQISAQTGAAGLMIGRGAIRNPWIFTQIREAFAGEVKTRPTLREVRAYVEALYESVCDPSEETRRREIGRCNLMKKYLHYIAPGVRGNDEFWREVRITTNLKELFLSCDRHLGTGEEFA